MTGPRRAKPRGPFLGHIRADHWRHPPLSTAASPATRPPSRSPSLLNGWPLERNLPAPLPQRRGFCSSPQPALLLLAGAPQHQDNDYDARPDKQCSKSIRINHCRTSAHHCAVRQPSRNWAGSATTPAEPPSGDQVVSRLLPRIFRFALPVCALDAALLQSAAQTERRAQCPNL